MTQRRTLALSPAAAQFLDRQPHNLRGQIASKAIEVYAASEAATVDARDLPGRVAALEEEIARLRAQVATLQAQRDGGEA